MGFRWVLGGILSVGGVISLLLMTDEYNDLGGVKFLVVVFSSFGSNESAFMRTEVGG